MEKINTDWKTTNLENLGSTFQDAKPWRSYFKGEENGFLSNRAEILVHPLSISGQTHEFMMQQTRANNLTNCLL